MSERLESITVETRCLHCTHVQLDTSSDVYGCPHCDHEQSTGSMEPDTCVHCILYGLDAPFPHRLIRALAEAEDD